VTTIAFHPNGKTVATGGVDRFIRLWDAATGQELAVLPPHLGRVHTVAFTPDGNALLSAADAPAADEVRLWLADEADGSPVGPNQAIDE
jgi:WD40 repeat protein